MLKHNIVSSQKLESLKSSIKILPFSETDNKKMQVLTSYFRASICLIKFNDSLKNFSLYYFSSIIMTISISFDNILVLL